MRYRLTIETKREEMKDITRTVADCIKQSGVINGICTVYCPHPWEAGSSFISNSHPDIAP